MRNHARTGIYVVGLVAALCAVALVTAARSHVSAASSMGYQVVRAATSETPSTHMKTVHVNCPAGKDVLGGGAVVGYQTGNSFVQDPNGILVESEPDGANGWQASGIDRTTGDAWGVAVYAICAKL